MSATSLIAEAKAAGVHLSLLGRDRITWACETDPPPGLIDRIRGAKADVLAALQVDEADHLHTFFEERAAIREYDGGLRRPEAEAGALRDAIAHWLVRNPSTDPPLTKSGICASPTGQTGKPARYP